MLIYSAKLIADAFFEHCDGLFGAAMKAKAIVVKGSGEVCRLRSTGADEIQSDLDLLLWVSQIAVRL
ncbi:MAG TPA: hypothetical protein VIE66_16305 [Methylocella sp.]|jgi:hypothetical protein